METDTQAIRQSALALLECKIEPNPTFPFLCNHPFTNAPFAALDNKLLDLTKPTEALRWRTAMRSVIQKKNAQGIFLLMNPPYRLFFLNLIRSVLSGNDFGELFRAFWPSVEQINGDKNLTRRSIIRLLQSVPKDCLMDKECFLAYQQLPQVFSVYRGVTRTMNHAIGPSRGLAASISPNGSRHATASTVPSGEQTSRSNGCWLSLKGRSMKSSSTSRKECPS